jgi:hypothetical protein
MQILYWIALALTAVLSLCLIFIYSHRKASLYVRALAAVSFTASLLCFAILPIDIY